MPLCDKRLCDGVFAHAEMLCSIAGAPTARNGERESFMRTGVCGNLLPDVLLLRDLDLAIAVGTLALVASFGATEFAFGASECNGLHANRNMQTSVIHTKPVQKVLVTPLH